MEGIYLVLYEIFIAMISSLLAVLFFIPIKDERFCNFMLSTAVGVLNFGHLAILMGVLWCLFEFPASDGTDMEHLLKCFFACSDILPN